LALLAALAVTHTPAVALADEAEALLEEAVIRFRVGRFKQALKVLKRARRKARDPRVKARVLLQLGCVHGVLKKKRAARKAFAAALKLDPTLVPPPDFKQSVLALFRQVKGAMKGTLSVTVDRAGARVTLDGQALGAAPLKVKVGVGNKKVVVATPNGLYRLEKTLTITVGGEHAVSGKLAFVGCKLNVKTHPRGARVTLDGKVLGVTPLVGILLTAGEHSLRMELAGRQPHSQIFLGQQGALHNIMVIMPREAGAAPVPKPAPASAPTPASAPAPASLPMDQPTPKKRRWPVWTLVSGGAALVAAGVGLGLGLASDSAFEKMQQTDDQNDYRDHRDATLSLETGANVSFAAAGALAVTAVVLYLLVERHPGEQKAEEKAPVSVRPSAFGLTLQF